MKIILPLLVSLAITNMALAQGSAFTYQGRLENAGVLAHGSYDFRPTLYDAPSGGSAVATSPIQTAVPVRNGLFVLDLDFGAAAFNGGERWLGLDVRTNNTGVYTPLSSRQRIAPTPYAIYAGKAGDLQAGASVTFSPASGPPFNVGSATKVPNLNADLLDGLDSGAFVLKAGDTMSGSLNVANPATINFGSSVRQMLNLWDTQYALGVQANTLYFRTHNHFAWYKDGSHGDSQFDPGGGTALMLLSAPGNLQVNSSAGAGVNCVSTASSGFIAALNGQCTANSGETHGVRGLVASAQGNAVYGINNSATGVGVFGVNGGGNPGRVPAAVYGESTAPAGNGVVGVANNGASAYGVWGRSSQGWAGVFDGAVRIAGDSAHDKPFLQLRETQDGDYARIQLQVANRPLWHVSVGGVDNSLVFYNSANSIVTSVSETGVLTTKVLTITGGADIAEPFEMSHDEIPKGSVVVIDEQNPGKLKLSARAYDTRVAGVISGAGGVQPGLTLQQEQKLAGGQQVALTGRVYVRADAGAGPIQPGDLLTTSDTPGHAMKVTDHARAQGAILGKAMSALNQGTGLVLVLVTLQ